jgi:hypothetical protein
LASSKDSPEDPDRQARRTLPGNERIVEVALKHERVALRREASA